MDRRQRGVLIGLTSVIGVVAVVLVVVALTNGGGSGRTGTVASAGTTAPEETTTSTAADEATTTIPVLPVDTTAPAPGSTVAAATTTTKAPAPVVSGAGAVLKPPPSAVTRPMGPPGCATLADPGWTADCGVAHAKGGDLVWLIETGPGGNDLRAGVWAHSTGTTWREVLVATGAAGGKYTHIKARVADLSGDGFDEIAFGFGVVGTQQLLQVDVVDGSRSVVAHLDLPHGSARVAKGQLDAWSGRDTASGSQWVHDVIRYQSGAWRIVSSTVVAQSSVPPSQL